MSEPSASSPAPTVCMGALALRYSGKSLPVQVLRSAAGHYIGTKDDEGPFSRESVEYFPTYEAAQHALDNHVWTQRAYP
ncbi:hypothetical protein [Chitinimonas koreensis]|uniref:hypothetical protein n=1 Tax=Chitinimonas koreensis TaxID=356302 RepID=UPI0004907C6C|nr:hypothetical protein [Chitinimonas koreensis]QNM96741.1 hypothetical protein H9L41_23850 [Chitinimonas koreensis]